MKEQKRFGSVVRRKRPGNNEIKNENKYFSLDKKKYKDKKFTFKTANPFQKIKSNLENDKEKSKEINQAQRKRKKSNFRISKTELTNENLFIKKSDDLSKNEFVFLSRNRRNRSISIRK